MSSRPLQDAAGRQWGSGATVDSAAGEEQNTPGREDAAWNQIRLRRSRPRRAPRTMQEQLVLPHYRRGHDNPPDATITRLLALGKDDPEERPDPDVFAEALSILRAARSQMGDFPRGAAGCDMDGGIQVEWSRGQRRVHLVLPAPRSRKRYIYHSEGDTHDIEDASPATLALRLRWLGDG